MNILKEYADEMDVQFLTLDSLIESHRFLRKEHQKTMEQRRMELNLVRETVRKQEMDNTWIKIKSLKWLTVNELSELIER